MGPYRVSLGLVVNVFSWWPCACMAGHVLFYTHGHASHNFILGRAFGPPQIPLHCKTKSILQKNQHRKYDLNLHVEFSIVPMKLHSSQP